MANCSNKRQRTPEGLVEAGDLLSANKEVNKSGNGNGSNSMSLVLGDPELLDCNICLEPLTPPVFQCKNGHIACSSCCSKYNNTCSYCSSPIGDIRCLIIEKFIDSIKLHCRYSSHGCKELLCYNQKSNHEETCICSPCKCPISDCNFLAPFEPLSRHIQGKHSSARMEFTFGKTFSVCFRTDSPFVAMQSSTGHLFLLNNFRKPNSDSAITVAALGTIDPKPKNLYRLTLKVGDNKLEFSSSAKLVNERQETLPKGEYSLTVPCEIVESLRFLKLDVYIYRQKAN
ncbi:hypothetical protein Scep_019980 [Stephania cephalantha]|uniref:RING-type E3 ubiquitin transferase n=1 Tax=Stephania cephalantha TaxID=152367 RepID=A0AAP0IBQ5_9MAGN